MLHIFLLRMLYLIMTIIMRIMMVMTIIIMIITSAMIIILILFWPANGNKGIPSFTWQTSSSMEGSCSMILLWNTSLSMLDRMGRSQWHEVFWLVKSKTSTALKSRQSRSSISTRLDWVGKQCLTFSASMARDFWRRVLRVRSVALLTDEMLWPRNGQVRGTRVLRRSFWHLWVEEQHYHNYLRCNY